MALEAHGFQHMTEFLVITHQENEMGERNLQHASDTASEAEAERHVAAAALEQGRLALTAKKVRDNCVSCSSLAPATPCSVTICGMCDVHWCRHNTEMIIHNDSMYRSKSLISGRLGRTCVDVS